MSAYIVPHQHIRYMLETLRRAEYKSSIRVCGADYYPLRDEDMQAVGQILVNANALSVNMNIRYSESEPADTFNFTPVFFGAFNPVQALKACDCFDYQASEVDDYRATAASVIVDCIRGAAIKQLPGYDDAEWGIG